MKPQFHVDVELAVVIVNYRTPVFIVECLKTLLPQLENLSSKVVLVDNDSADGSPGTIVAWLAENDLFRKVQFVQSEVNSGFAGGNNSGIRAIGADYYLLLNSDTLVRPRAISILLESAKQAESAGLISPRLEWPDGTGQESCFRFQSPMSELVGAAQTAIFDKVFSKYVVPMPVQTRSARPQWTSFACVLVKREVLEQTGLLDEGFFMYFEDVEFCHRARNAGWQILHLPDARVVHLRGGSSPVKEHSRLKKRLPRYYYESRTRYFYLTYGWLGLTAANLLWWFGRSVSRTRQWLGRPDKAMVERQWLDIWINWLSPLRPYTHPEGSADSHYAPD